MTPSKVMVSGSSGFIGGYVVEELLARDYEVVGADLARLGLGDPVVLSADTF